MYNELNSGTLNGTFTLSAIFCFPWNVYKQEDWGDYD